MNQFLRSMIFRTKMATECVVCLEMFQDQTEFIPKLLPCSHTLCFGCLKQLTRESQIQCPECRKIHPVSTQGAQDFPTNRYVLDYIDLVKKSGQLELRKKSGSTDARSSGQETLQCVKHMKPCVMFCVDLHCGQLLCTECQIQAHANHRLVGLTENLQNIVDLGKLVHDIATEKEALMVFGDNVTESKAVVSRKAKDAEEEIEKKVDSAIQEAKRIKMQIQQRLQKCTELLENKQEDITHCMIDCDQISKDLDCFQNTAEKPSTVSIVNLVQKVVRVKASSKQIRSNDVTNEVNFDENPFSLPPVNHQSISFQYGAAYGSGLQPTAPNYHEIFPEKRFADKSTQTIQPLSQKPWSAMSPQERQERLQQRRQDAARRSDEIHQRYEERMQHFDMRRQQIREKNKEILELGLCMCCIQKIMMK